ncbi:MAG: amidohydrolase family protein [Chitinophagaceae bacterium]|nr:amidohydrolase family protein [Chitinophagaceae bacterium]
MIIDCHCHAGKGDGLTGAWDTNAPLHNYLKWADEYGIVKTNLFAAFHSDYAKANYEVAKIVNKNPGRFYGFAFINAARDAGRIYNMVKTAIEKYSFCGIKVHRHDARISREICEAAREFNVTVLYDPMGEISTVELIANEYPDVNFIIPHLSSFADDWKAQIGFVSILERYPNIYTDTSGIRRFDVLKEALERAGSGKILFGSDGPWLHPGVELEKIYALNLSEEDSNKILYKNFLKLINNIIHSKKTNYYVGQLQTG